MNKRKVIIAVTGASGAIYAKQLIDTFYKIKNQCEDIAIVFSKNGLDVWQYELNENTEKIPFTIYQPDDFFAPFASGSANYDTMIVCPCTMGTLASIANGIADDLIKRAADVIIKERRKLVLVTREMPLNLIHIKNMLTITQCGGIICPASPNFYSKPQTYTEIVQTVVDRIINLCNFEIDSFRWQTTKATNNN